MMNAAPGWESQRSKECKGCHILSNSLELKPPVQALTPAPRQYVNIYIYKCNKLYGNYTMLLNKGCVWLYKDNQNTQTECLWNVCNTNTKSITLSELGAGCTVRGAL